jgi:hypothetical protein
MAALTLAELVIKAEQLYTHYPTAAADYRRAKQGLALPVPRHLINDSQRNFQVQNKHCRRYWLDLYAVREAVAGFLPNLPLRLLPIVGEPWHEQAEFDWPAACTELEGIAYALDKLIEAAAPPPQTPHANTAKENDAAYKWMYNLCMQGTSYGTIRVRLNKKPKAWPRYNSDNGVKKAIVAYAKRNNLPEPSPRKAGKPRAR